jgi:hypothetical protein
VCAVSKVTYYRPNRKKPRYFKPCDVARIAKNCVQDNELPAELVLAYVARGLGFTHISLHKREEEFDTDDGVQRVSGLVKELEEMREILNAFLKKYFDIEG